MKKFIFFIVLLVFSNTLGFGQQLTVKPSKYHLNQYDEALSLDQYLSKNIVSNTKASIWYSSMANASDWVAAKLPSQAANITNTWEWKADTGSFSLNWDNYVGPYMGSTTPMAGVFYFEGITNLITANYGISNSVLTNALPISTIGHPSVNIKFYQLYKSFNDDSTLLEVSTDNLNWHSIQVNPRILIGGANSYAIGWKEYSITQWAGNQAQVWIRFRFFAPASTSSGPQFGGGYGWAIDDVELFDPDNHKIIVDRTTLYDGYTKIPVGLGRPLYYDADFNNIGGMTQTNVRLHGVEITTGADSTSRDTTLLPGGSAKAWDLNNFFFTPAAIGNYKVFAYISSDSIPFMLAQDTFDIKVHCDTCIYSRDNNTYVSSRGAGSTGVLSDPFTAVSRFLVNQDRMAYGVNAVVNTTTKVGSKIRAVLYKFFAASGTRTIVAQSVNYFITANDIPATAPMVNPPSISLPFITGYTMQKDTIYWVGIQVYGGTDTVRIATDNTGIPQYEQTSLYFDPSANTWFIWGSGNVPALMIRTVFNQYQGWSVGIDERKQTEIFLTCMPNPASKSTQISYALKKSESISIKITDITGRIIKTMNLGMQSVGDHMIEVDVSGLAVGSYFYTLKTPTLQATEKLIIVK